MACALAALMAGACASRPPCALEGTAEVVAEEGPADGPGGRRLVVWDLAASDVLWREARPASAALEAFRHEARRRVGDVTARRLVTEALAHPIDDAQSALDRDLLAHVAERARPMRCFEALFLARQAERLDMIVHPSEFLAVVLRPTDDDPAAPPARLRVIEYTVNHAGIGNLGRVGPRLDAELASGQWRLWTVLHNHNFFFEGDAWRGGNVAPSVPDAGLLAMQRDALGLTEFWITNGFETAIAPTRALP